MEINSKFLLGSFPDILTWVSRFQIFLPFLLKIQKTKRNLWSAFKEGEREEDYLDQTKECGSSTVDQRC